MGLSVRDPLSGTVTSVTADEVMAEVVVELEDGRTITRGSADRLELAPGDAVEAVGKASDVMLRTD
jgi:molybdopterin-binding protein